MERVGIQEVRRGRRTAGEQQLRQEEANGGSGSERDGSPAEDHSLRFHSERPLLLSAAAGREVEPFPAQQRAESAAHAHPPVSKAKLAALGEFSGEPRWAVMWITG